MFVSIERTNYLCTDICYRTVGIRVESTASQAAFLAVRLRRHGDVVNDDIATNGELNIALVQCFANLIVGERYVVEFILNDSRFFPSKAFIQHEDGAFPAIHLEFLQIRRQTISVEKCRNSIVEAAPAGSDIARALIRRGRMSLTVHSLFLFTSTIIICRLRHVFQGRFWKFGILYDNTSVQSTFGLGFGEGT